MKFFNDWFSRIARERRRRTLQADLEVGHIEYSADLVTAAIDSQKHVLNVMMEATEYADQFQNADPVKARLVDLYKRGLVNQAMTLQRLMQGPAASGEVIEAELFQPSESASTSGTASPRGLPSEPPAKALPDANGAASGKAGQPALESPQGPSSPPAAKRGRGRPRKTESSGQGPSKSSQPPSEEPQP